MQMDDAIVTALIYATPPTLAVILNARRATRDRSRKHAETVGKVDDVQASVNGERSELLRRIADLESRVLSPPDQ